MTPRPPLRALPSARDAYDGDRPAVRRLARAPTIASLADDEAEMAVLAAVMLTDGHPNVTYLRLAALGVDAEAFSDPRRGIVWQAFDGLARKGRPVDILTLADELRSMNDAGRLNTVGGVQFLGEITDFIPTIAHCESHGEIVMDHARVRLALAKAQEMVVTATSGGSAVERLAKIRALASEIPHDADTARRVWIADHLEDAWGEFERLALAKAAGHTVAARFGVEALDGSSDGLLSGMLGGIFRQNVVTIFGSPGAGKTTFSAQAAVVTAQDALASAGGNVDAAERVLMFATEMRGPQVAMRLACARAGVDFNRLRSGKASSEEQELAFQACAELSRLPIDIIDSKVNRGRISADDIAAHVHARVARGDRVGLVIVDYFQDLARCRGFEKSNETAEQEERAKRIHHVAEEADVPLILVSSMTKNAPKDHTTGKAATVDTRGAGLDYASDVMMGLVNVQSGDSAGSSAGKGKRSRDTYDEADGGSVPDGCVLVRVDVPKNRYGATGDVTILYDKRKGQFLDRVGQKMGAMPETTPADTSDDEFPPFNDASWR